MATFPAPKGRLTRLRLKNFKSFAEADLKLGPLTVLVGTNASGKSNIRDAFRFLHGLSRGYTLPETIGEKWVEGGYYMQWPGIRGGMPEIAAPGATSFGLAVEYQHFENAGTLIYQIEVAVAGENGLPTVLNESLTSGGRLLFNSVRCSPPENALVQISILPDNKHAFSLEQVEACQPALPQIPPTLTTRPAEPWALDLAAEIQELVDHIRAMRFLDPSPDHMRTPSSPGQAVIGDRGENLSSVLQTIAADPRQRETLVHWIQELTPMDARDLEFPEDRSGKVLLSLVEHSGLRISAYSASDGTLRFLALLAALLRPLPARFFFVEELENGIHPTRLHLLLQLIEQNALASGIQIVATTHSPQVLGLLGPQSREYAALTYRLAGKETTEVKRIVDIPEASAVLAHEDWSRLLASGWLENVAAFAEDAERVKQQ